MKAKNLLTRHRGLKAAARPCRVVRGWIGVTPKMRAQQKAKKAAFMERVKANRLDPDKIMDELMNEKSEAGREYRVALLAQDSNRLAEVSVKRMKERAAALPARVMLKPVVKASSLALDAAGIFEPGKRKEILRILGNLANQMRQSESGLTGQYTREVKKAVGNSLRANLLLWFFLRNYIKLLR